MTKKQKREGSLCFEITPALLVFRTAAGNANRCLNTLLVGLETLRSHDPIRPQDLVLAWSKPGAGTDEWMEARNFALRATMVAVVDGLDQFLRILTEIDGLVALELHDILRGRQTSGTDHRPTIPERLSTLCERYPGVGRQEYRAAVKLLATWRNQFVHRDYKHPLTSAERKKLLAAASYFKQEHGGADIAAALARYEKREPPTLGDLSTLIASAQRLTRAIDDLERCWRC
jgi:hypothetical protein